MVRRAQTAHPNLELSLITPEKGVRIGIAEALKRPGIINVWDLRFDPHYTKLRGNPRRPSAQGLLWARRPPQAASDHDKVAYDKAVDVVHALTGHKLNHDKDDYLAIMARLLEDYESENVPAPARVGDQP